MEKLLNILSDGEYHSGEELGKLLGISRTAIWKQMQKVEALGLAVESQKGCGYRIVGGLDLLSEAMFSNHLSIKSKALIKKCQLESTVTSTNELARQQAEAGNASGLVILAEQQTQGRGRRGRQWVSPYGCNLYASLVWGFDGGVQAVEGLSLAVGVAARRAAVRCGIEELKLKWPNDLLWKKKKVGGILLEIVGDPTGFCQVVIGVGINIGMPEVHAHDIDQKWADLNQLSDKVIGRNEFAGTLVDEILLLLSNYHEVGFTAYRGEWVSHDAYANEPVKLLLVSKAKEGIAKGVDEAGALRLEVDGELQIFSGGEISLRGRK
jgi:BirA family biotin operon repressor/biotin-[acetyl-CoA-carboxylase] ligase